VVRVKPGKQRIDACSHSLLSIPEAALNVRYARKISDATHA